MGSFFIKNRKYLLAAIIILAAFLIFFRLTRADIQTDDATYSLRAIGYFDFMDSDIQTTPVSWFEEIPWWSRLSFHDAPPLVFIIQYLFFKFLGVSVLVARLPFALVGLGSVILLYFIGQRLYNEKIGLLASFLLAIFSYQTWASRIGYLEGIALFFILLTFYLFLKGMAEPKKFIWFGIALGLTLLTKYTTFFILPVIFFYILFKNKKIFINKYFIFSIVIAVLLFSPVIFYNIMMYQTRGHFDLQFASLLGQDMSDWPIMAEGGIAKDYFSQVINIWQQFSTLYSSPIYLIMIASIFYVLVNFFWHFKKKKNLFIILILLFATIQFSLLGVSIRFLSIFNPFIALILAWSLIRIYQKFIKAGNWIKLKKVVYASLLIVFFSFELFYNLNTNIFYQPFGQANEHYSTSRWGNSNFSQLEDYLKREGNFGNLKMISITKFDDFAIDLFYDTKDENIFIYDSNLNWFSSVWYFRRWALYYRTVFIPVTDLAQILPDIDWFDYFRQAGVKNVYFIWGRNPVSFDPSSDLESQEWVEKPVKIFEISGAEVTEIRNINNQLAFKVYKLKLNE